MSGDRSRDCAAGIDADAASIGPWRAGPVARSAIIPSANAAASSATIGAGPEWDNDLTRRNMVLDISESAGPRQAKSAAEMVRQGACTRYRAPQKSDAIPFTSQSP